MLEVATRVVAGVKVRAGGGKGQKSRRSMAPEAFTIAAIGARVAMICLTHAKTEGPSSVQMRGLRFEMGDTGIEPVTSSV
ncbi:hypothetical protein JNUCC0626_47255 [Lentzea sp. JNUCC 0626]|uniref:hypothetical protein n=1 Tax=Lentzea sp. JNUCC 0626 TaxID=3367513 RepID=UPI0037494C23